VKRRPKVPAKATPAEQAIQKEMLQLAEAADAITARVTALRDRAAVLPGKKIEDAAFKINNYSRHTVGGQIYGVLAEMLDSKRLTDSAQWFREGARATPSKAAAMERKSRAEEKRMAGRRKQAAKKEKATSTDTSPLIAYLRNVRPGSLKNLAPRQRQLLARILHNLAPIVASVWGEKR
jgi:hypothetical protein